MFGLCGGGWLKDWEHLQSLYTIIAWPIPKGENHSDSPQKDQQSFPESNWECFKMSAQVSGSLFFSSRFAHNAIIDTCANGGRMQLSYFLLKHLTGMEGSGAPSVRIVTSGNN